MLFYQIWDRVLSEAEVNDIFSEGTGDITQSQLSANLVLDWGWGHYTTAPNTRRIPETERGLLVCDLGEVVSGSGVLAECVPDVDKTPPQVMTCPDPTLLQLPMDDPNNPFSLAAVIDDSMFFVDEDGTEIQNRNIMSGV